MTDRELMQRAFIELKDLRDGFNPESTHADEVLDALRARLAQPEQKPRYGYRGKCERIMDDGAPCGLDAPCPDCGSSLIDYAQPESEPWKCDCGANLYIDENGKPRSKVPPEKDVPEVSFGNMEPVAWIDASGHPKHLKYLQSASERKLYGELQPLYAAPPQREENHDGEKFVYRAITRSGEIAHFGVYSAAKAWAKSGTVEEVPIRTFKVVQKPCSSCESLARAVMLDQTYHENIIAQRKWQGLTDADIAQTMHGSVEGSNVLPYQFARAIEAKLKEKNA